MLKKISETPYAVQWKDVSGIYLLAPVSESVIRCVYTVFDSVADSSEMIERQLPEPVEYTLEADKAGWTVRTKRLSVHIDRENGRIVYRNQSGAVLLKEAGREAEKKQLVRYTTGGKPPVIERRKTVDGERNFIQNLQEEAAGTACKARLHFAFTEEEEIFGFGQAEEGIRSYRYADQYLYQHNMRIPMPFFVSTKGYGMLTDCGSVMTWHGGRRDSYLFLDTVRQIDTYFIAGSCPDEIIKGFRMLTGHARMLPRWCFGYIQSKEMYHTAEELTEVVREYRRRGIPLDCVVQDWNSWKPGHWGEKQLDEERYAHAEAALEQIHDLHAHAMISVWPTAAEGTKDYEEFLQNGYLLNDCATYNAFDPEARRLFWRQAEAGLFSKGFDAWWCDSSEPFTGQDWCGAMKREPWERYVLVAGEHKAYLDPLQSNLYGKLHAQGIYENQRETTEEKRVVNLTRSGYPGSQKYGVILWSGDTSASWETLKIQITEGLQMGMSGYPYWTLDIGGFFTVHENWRHRGCGNHTNPEKLWFWHGDYENGAEDEGYRELYTRWLQFAVFLPVFRAHGTDTPREIWHFGEPGTMFYDAIEAAIGLRYSLIPYIYSLAAEVCLNDATMMRSLYFDFAEDPEIGKVTDGYLFGKSLLVYPVTEPMYYERNSTPINREKKKRCYLPRGCGWYDFWTDEYYEGGQYVNVDAPIDRIPLFVRAGSILPWIPPVMYADEAEGKELTLLIYTGADGSFRYYEDSGDGYDCEKGAYAVTEFYYDEKSGKLSCMGRVGGYSQMKPLHYGIQWITH